MANTDPRSERSDDYAPSAPPPTTPAPGAVGAVIPGAIVTDKPVDHLSEIERLADELSRASPSGAETIVERIKMHVAAIRGGGPAGTFATKHESLVADDKITGAGRTATEVQRSGVALPAGVSVHDRSEDGAQPPVPVAPADPQDVDEALQTGKSVASPVVVQPVAPVQTGLTPLPAKPL